VVRLSLTFNDIWQSFLLNRKLRYETAMKEQENSLLMKVCQTRPVFRCNSLSYLAVAPYGDRPTRNNYRLMFSISQKKSTSWPSLWPSGQSSWPQIQRSGFDSRHNQIFLGVLGLERDPLSFVSTIEELLGRKSSGSSLENREYDRRDPSLWPLGNFYPQTLALTSPTSSGSRSV
jgi:hypothetical protein